MNKSHLRGSKRSSTLVVLKAFSLNFYLLTLKKLLTPGSMLDYEKAGATITVISNPGALIFLLTQTFLALQFGQYKVRQVPETCLNNWMSERWQGGRGTGKHTKQKQFSYSYTYLHLRGSQPCRGKGSCVIEQSHEPHQAVAHMSHAGPPKMVGSQWGVLMKRGPLEERMANHSSILATRTPWAVWKGKSHDTGRQAPSQKVSSMLLGRSEGNY